MLSSTANFLAKPLWHCYRLCELLCVTGGVAAILGKRVAACWGSDRLHFVARSPAAGLLAMHWKRGRASVWYHLMVHLCNIVRRTSRSKLVQRTLAELPNLLRLSSMVRFVTEPLHTKVRHQNTFHSSSVARLLNVP
jgi:hypothetical protein